MDSNIQAECSRFEGVMNARKKAVELISLFDKLAVSDKFSAEAKPYCYGLLMKTATKLVPDRELSKLLVAIGRNAAVDKVRQVETPEAADQVVAAVLRRVFQAAAQEPAPLMRAFAAVESAGLSESRSHTLGLLCLSGMDTAQVDQVCDITYEAFYGQPVAA